MQGFQDRAARDGQRPGITTAGDGQWDAGSVHGRAPAVTTEPRGRALAPGVEALDVDAFVRAVGVG